MKSYERSCVSDEEEIIKLVLILRAVIRVNSEYEEETIVDRRWKMKL